LTTIALVGVSAGQTSVGMLSPRAYVPVVDTLTLAAATVSLTSAGFQTTASYQANAALAGTVISSVPAAGTFALQGSTVVLTVSSGPVSPTTGPISRAAKLPNLPNKMLDRSEAMTDSQGQITGPWWRLLLNVTNQAFGTNSTPETTISVGTTPFVYTPIVSGSVIVSGGAVSLIEYSKDGQMFYPTGVIGGVFQMIASSSLRVTYSSPPALTFFPR